MARPSRTRPADDWKSARWPYTMPTPDVREGGHSLWQLWEEATRNGDKEFAPTQPAASLAVSTAAPTATTATTAPSPPPLHPPTADVLLRAARHDNRVCPRPAAWTRLYEALGGPRAPDLRPPPVQSWQWAALSSLEKRLHFRAHVEWAARHRRLKAVAAFMAGLAETDWLHMGES